MTKTDISVVLCKLVGLYFMINSIYGLGNSLIMVGIPLLFGGLDQFSTRLILNIALPSLFQLLVGLVVWRKAIDIGSRMAA